MKRWFACSIIAVGLLGALVGKAYAQTSGNIRLVVPYSPGGTADALARALQNRIGKALGKTVIVENVAGAAGAVGAAQVSRAEPDGLTLLFTNVGPSAIAPAVQKGVAYDPVNGFTPIALVARSPLLLVVHPSVRADSLADLIRLAKSTPRGLDYSSAGFGSFGHLTTELFAQAAGITLVHVSYRGQAPALQAVLAGEVQLSLTAPSGAMAEFIQEGKLKLLGVSSRVASPLTPGAQPIANLLPNFEALFWFGIVGPPKMNEALVDQLNKAVRSSLNDAELIELFKKFEVELVTGTAGEFAQLIASEAQFWRKVVESRNLHAKE